MTELARLSMTISLVEATPGGEQIVRAVTDALHTDIGLSGELTHKAYLRRMTHAYSVPPHEPFDEIDHVRSLKQLFQEIGVAVSRMHDPLAMRGLSISTMESMTTWSHAVPDPRTAALDAFRANRERTVTILTETGR